MIMSIFSLCSILNKAAKYNTAILPYLSSWAINYKTEMTFLSRRLNVKEMKEVLLTFLFSAQESRFAYKTCM